MYNLHILYIRCGILNNAGRILHFQSGIKSDYTDLCRQTALVKEKYDKLIEEGLVPLKRWGFPLDVGKAAAILAKGDLDYSTGLVLEVSGGMDIRSL